MVEPIFDYQFRLILIGDTTVGKSSLLRYFTDGKFFEVSDPTVGVDFFARLVEVADGTRIKLQLWDTAGQERFRSITRSYYRNSVGALVVFDVCKKRSLEHVPMWIMEAKRHMAPHQAVFVLVGTKSDLSEQREVRREDAEALAKFYGIKYVETSAYMGSNVEKAFTCITQDVYDKVKAGELGTEEGWDGIKSGYGRLGSGNSDSWWHSALAATLLLTASVTALPSSAPLSSISHGENNEVLAVLQLAPYALYLRYSCKAAAIDYIWIFTLLGCLNFVYIWHNCRLIFMLRQVPGCTRCLYQTRKWFLHGRKKFGEAKP
ncbi:ras-related protein Rab-39B [Hyalella azteca]|uniref:Ras-related protein Rab-39B n=1 Tax=Hyalella azteca TaxID=294128 RepID=A0A979FL34_HYAAZ|nr:ras-related protein Rab-39B [Hyalella azteca]